VQKHCVAVGKKWNKLRLTIKAYKLSYNYNDYEGHVKYLGLHLDRKLTWQHHIFTKRTHLGVTLTKMYWLLGRKSQLSLSNKLLLYKTILKPIWTYGVQLWGTASTSNLEILEHFQSKALRLIVDTLLFGDTNIS
jgi:hypothetical protein